MNGGGNLSAKAAIPVSVWGNRDMDLESFRNVKNWAVYRFILAAVFFCGMAHIAFLPPFEGFDEPAHWSSIAQIGHDGDIPIYGQARFDEAVENYPGPMPYTFPKDISYASFDPASDLGPHKSKPPQEFKGVGGHNWQAQHPPLYYLMLQPVFKVFNHMSWADQFFALRTLSWIFAFAGLVIGVEASRNLFAEDENRAAIIMSAWPFLVPQFFPEMARIGNDSLCLLCFGIAWLSLLKMDQKKGLLKWSLILGFSLGAGLWTKAFFVPITAGIVAYFGWRYWLDLETETLKYGSLAIGLAFLLGAGWYAYKLLAYGNAIGGDEMLQFDKDGGVLVNFLSNFSVVEVLRGYATMLMSFVYTGSWSLVRTSPFLLLGPVLLLGWVGFNWLKSIKKKSYIRLLPVFVLLPMLAGLTYHQMLRIAIDGLGTGTPGWYLHILTPALASIIAWGWPKHWGVNLLVAYGLVFAAYSWVMQLALFSGCSIESTEKGHAMLDPEKACLINAENLKALTFPELGMGMLLIAFGFGVVAWMKSRVGHTNVTSSG